MKDKDPKDRDWDREMREVDKLLAKLPDAEPTLGRGVPTVPVSPHPSVGGVARAGALQPAGRARGRAWLTTWLRVGLGIALGVGMLVWPYTHACGLKLVFYLIGATTVTIAGVWSALTSWKRRLGIAHTLSIILIIWGLALAGRQLLPRVVIVVDDEERHAAWHGALAMSVDMQAGLNRHAGLEHAGSHQLSPQPRAPVIGPGL